MGEQSLDTHDNISEEEAVVQQRADNKKGIHQKDTNDDKVEAPEPAAAAAAATTTTTAILGPAYASPLPPFIFWVELLCIAFQSAVLGVVSFSYLKAISSVSELWLALLQDNGDYPQDSATTGFLDGKPFWIAIGAGTGLIVGVLKAYVFQFDSYPGFIQDLTELDADPVTSFKVAVCCLVSIMGGASIGPESGLGAACGGLSVVFSKYVNILCRWCVHQHTITMMGGEQDNDDEDAVVQQLEQEEIKRRKLMVLAAFVAAFSTIFPSPAAALLLCMELATFEKLATEHGFHYVRTIVLLVFAGTISFLVYTTLEDETLIPGLNEFPGFAHRYSNMDIALALGYGFMGAVLALAYFVIGGTVKKVVGALKLRLEKKVGRELCIVIVAVIGGVIFGTLNYIFPLIVGDGSLQLGTVVVRGGEIDSAVLVVSTFVKMAAFWICSETGFVGGLFFPLLLASTMFGRIFVNELDASLEVTVACSLVALVSAFVPIPVGMMLLSYTAFNLSARGSIPVFVCVVTANALFVGTGFPQALIALAARPSPKKGDANGNGGDDDNESGGE